MEEVVPKGQREERVLFSTMGLVGRLATNFQMPLRRLKQLLELGYYRETRRRGFKMQQIQDTMSVGFSKVGLLSRQLKDHNAKPGSGLGLKRRIILLLWAVPLTEGHLFTAFPEAPRDRIEAALEELVAEGRIERVEGRTTAYKLAANLQRLVEDKWVGRIEALNSLVLNVAQVVEQRFFAAEGDAPEGFVRTLNFRANREDLHRLEEAYRAVILPLVQELDGDVEEDEASIPVKLSYLWSHNIDLARVQDSEPAQQTEDEDKGE